MATTSKLTQLDALFAAASCDALAPDVREVLAHMAAQKSKPRAKSDVPTRSQRENATLDESVRAWALSSAPESFGSTDVRDALGLLTWQKAAKSLDRLAAEGFLVRMRVKGKTLYSLK